MRGIAKELRALAWPTAAVLAAAALPIGVDAAGAAPGFMGAWPRALGAAGFHLGAALLAALPFGAEFQQRTLGLLLVQPVGRARLWRVKTVALLCALAPLGVLQYGAAHAGHAGTPPGAALGFLAVMACAGTCWTLLARSTIGGAAFSLAALMLVETASVLAVSRLSGAEVDLFAGHPGLAAARGAYAAVMLWAGWRVLARYETREETARGAGGWGALRCDPTHAVANLVRKELRLQAPAFLIAALFAACWLAALLVFAVSPARSPSADAVLVAMLATYAPLVLIVSATISAGEESSLGIRLWHLTLPVPSRTQWIVKLGVTSAVGAVLAVGLPLSLAALAQAVLALPGGTLELPPPRVMLFLSGGLLVAGFWASMLTGDTVRAAVAAGAAAGVLIISAAAAGWIGWTWGFGTDALTWAMVRFQLTPDAFPPSARAFRRLDALAPVVVMAALAPLALRQSLAAYRSARVERRRIAGWGVQLALAAALVAFVPAAYMGAVAALYQSGPVRELDAALRQVLASPAGVPDTLAVHDLDSTGLLSADARRWLAGSLISVGPPRPAGRDGTTYVVARVTFPNGREFRTFGRLPPSAR